VLTVQDAECGAKLTCRLSLQVFTAGVHPDLLLLRFLIPRAGYFASLPGREYLPMFWSQGELQLLAGTALEGVAEDDRCGCCSCYVILGLGWVWVLGFWVCSCCPGC
jgi:hypothetical protein